MSQKGAILPVWGQKEGSSVHKVAETHEGPVKWRIRVRHIREPSTFYLVKLITASVTGSASLIWKWAKPVHRFFSRCGSPASFSIS